MRSSLALIIAAAVGIAVVAPASAQPKRGASAVGGTAGSAAAGGTSASTMGLGATSSGSAGTSSAIASGGSAAAAEGRATSSTRINRNPQMLQARSRAAAMDGGTWSRSMTHTRVRQGESVGSWTRSMSHQPGGKPAMSSSRVR